MKIIHIASEFAPLAKVGGLADVVYSLSKALRQEGHEVEVILPKYGFIDPEEIKNFTTLHEKGINSFCTGTIENLKVTLLDSPIHPHYFSREHVYGYHDDFDRFIHFSKLAASYLRDRKDIDIVHLHDWPVAIITAMIEGASRPSIFLNIHNLEHQGKCGRKHLVEADLDDLFPVFQDPHEPLLINLLLGGIRSADCIVTVSPTYEKEVLTPEFGFNLERELQKRQDCFFGILNGIDPVFWNPETDKKLKVNYSINSPEKINEIRAAKKSNRRYLCDQLQMKNRDVPLISSVTRLVHQKAPKLIKHALEHTLEKGGQFILLGSTHSPDMKEEFESLKSKYSQNQDVAILLDKQEALAHLIYAASDMFVIPSIFEPCGLTQMIGMRYGTVPIARRTGGLRDTVFDVDTSDRPYNMRNGFTFDHPTTQGVDWALDRAFSICTDNGKKWQEVMVHGMSMDFSWSKTVHEYIDLYKRFHD